MDSAGEGLGVEHGTELCAYMLACACSCECCMFCVCVCVCVCVLVCARVRLHACTMFFFEMC